MFGRGPCENGFQLPPPEAINYIPELAGNMESEWAVFHAAIAEAAAQSCGSKVTGASRGGNPRICWWTPKVKGAVEMKKETLKAEDADSYRQDK